MKRIILAALAFCTAGFLFAQTAAQSSQPVAQNSQTDAQGNSSLTEPDPTIVGRDSAREALREVSVDKFEREGSWNVRMSPDAGVITARLFDGSPAGKEPLPDDKDDKEGDTHVLGIKAEFFRRGVNSVYIKAARPLPIEGITKTVSVWVAGRNQDHSLYLLVEDYNGNDFELYMGSLGFSGWKKLTVAVPPTSDGEHGIVQQSAYHGTRPGLRIIGFRIDCDPAIAIGNFYVYFDDLRAVTDLYDLQNKDADDMLDNW